jgi:hypothetical protein
MIGNLGSAWALALWEAVSYGNTAFAMVYCKRLFIVGKRGCFGPEVSLYQDAAREFYFLAIWLSCVVRNWIVVAVTIAGVASSGDTARGFCDGSAVCRMEAGIWPRCQHSCCRVGEGQGVPPLVVIRSFSFSLRFLFGGARCALARAV